MAKKGIVSKEFNAELVAETPAPSREVLKVARALRGEPKRTVFIPLDPMDKKNLILTAAINGYRFSIPRGKAIDVPESLYYMLDNLGLTQM